MTELHVAHDVQLSQEQVDRAIGALVGSACGDALGAPFEFGPAGGYRARFPEPSPDGESEMIGGGSFGWAPGEFTDDTQMALALAESLAAHHGFEADDVWQRWQAWASDATDVGMITRTALGERDRQRAAAAAHRRLGRSAGNGALMRVTPVGIAFSRTRPEAAAALTVRVALEQAALTHFDPHAGWGAAVAAELVRRAIVGADAFDELELLIDLLPGDIAVRFAPLLSPRWHPGADGPPGNGTVWGCLAQAVWAARTHDSFHDAVVAAVDLGDDADTVACVTGALAGAIHGVGAIPERWRTWVHGVVATPDGVVRYDAERLHGLARRLLGID